MGRNSGWSDALQGTSLNGPALHLGPGNDLTGAPNLPHGESSDGLWKPWPGGDLVDPLARYAEQRGDLRRSDELLHGEQAIGM